MWKFSPILLEATVSRQANNSSSSANFNPLLFYDSRRNPHHFPQANQHQNTLPATQQSPLTQCIWTFFWLAILIFIAYPIGLISCELYVLVSPFGACCSCFTKFTDLLLRLAHFPLICTQNMIQAKPLILM